MGGKEGLFQETKEEIGIGRTEPTSHGAALSLQIKLIVERESIVGEDDFG